MTDDSTIDRLAREILGLPPRDKITMARDLLDSPTRCTAGTKRAMVAAILRSAADDLERGK